jgi:isovaleryl-CoA dehydrogenase
MGIRGSPTSELVFDNCFVPDSNILGGVDKGVYVLMRGLNYERVIGSAHPCGLMLNALDVVVPYVKERKQFGQSIGDFQLIQAKLADMWTMCEASRSYGYVVSMLADAGKANNKDCASVFLLASENAMKVALEAVQCFGGNGYINDFPVGRLMRDAKINEIYGGTKEIRRLVIGREMTGSK